MRFDSATRTLSFENGHTALFHGEELHFEVLADTTTMEFCFQDSSMATYAMAPEHMSLILKGNARCGTPAILWRISGNREPPE